MEIFWNNGEHETIKGLDILGIRQLDQRIEQDWVSNVTTISYRARYLSLLSWLFVEYYNSQLTAEDGQATFDENHFNHNLGDVHDYVYLILENSTFNGELLL